MGQLNDHDLLTKISVNVENICRKLDKFEERIEKAECKVDDAVRLSWFKWVGGGVMTLIFSSLLFLSGVVYQHHVTIQDVHSTLKNHIYFTAAVLKKETGKDWNNITRQELLDARDSVEQTWHEAEKKEDE